MMAEGFSMVMSGARLFRRAVFAAAGLAALAALASPSGQRAAGPPTSSIGARVLSISDDGLTVVINRGRAEKIVPGSDCVIRPNRGTDRADIEWDLVFAKGTVEQVSEGRSTVKITQPRQPLRVRDYCVVQSTLPASLFESDLGRLALFDVTVVGRDGRPLFTLKDLAADPSPRAIEALTTKIFQEIRRTPPAWVTETYGSETIKIGRFFGKTLAEVFPVATREDVVKCLEYRASFSGDWNGFDVTIAYLYADWAWRGFPSGEGEKRSRRAAPFLEKGDEAASKQDLLGALAEYRNALAVDPDNAEAKSSFKTATAVLERRKALQDDPKDVAALHALGLDLFRLRLYEQSLAELLKARDIGDDSTELAKYIGYAHAALHHFAEARQALEPLAARFPQDTDIRKWLDFNRQNQILAEKGSDPSASAALGDIKLQEGNYDSAISYYNDALDQMPQDAAIWAKIGKAAARRRAAREEAWAKDSVKNGRYDVAEADWQAALKIVREIGDKDGEKEILKGMAEAEYEADRYDKAVEAFQAIRALDPADVSPVIELARTYDDWGDHAQAVLWAERGVAEAPANDWAYNVLGTVQENAGHIDQAAAAYRKAIELSPDYKDALYNLGNMVARQRDYAQAGEIFRKVLGMDPNYSLARTRLTSLEAIVECRRLLGGSPVDPDARRRLVRALFDLKDYPGALAELPGALAANDLPAWALEMRGKCLVRQGHFAEGRADLEASLRKAANPDVRAWLGYAEAEEILSRDPKDPLARIKRSDDSIYWESYDAALANLAKAQEFGADPAEVLPRMERARRGQEAKRQLDLAVEAYDRAQFENALEDAQRSLAIYRELGTRRGQINALLRIGWSQASLFRHDAALSSYSEAGRIAGELGDDAVTARYLSSLSDYYSNICEYEKALDLARQAGDLYHRANDLLNEAWSPLPSMGWIKRQLGDTAGERDCYAKALAINQRLCYPWGEASNHLSIAWAYEWEGDAVRAIEAFNKGLAITLRLNDRTGTLNAYAGLATIYAQVGDAANAQKYGLLYLEMAQAMGRKSDRANALNKLGLLHLELVKDYAKAREYFQGCVDLARLIGDRASDCVASANIAVVLSREGKPREALPIHEESLRRIREMKDRYLEMQGLHEEGETYLRLAEHDRAVECLRRAIEIARFMGARSEQWQYELTAGKIFEAKGDLPKAIETYKQAAETLKGIKAKISSEAMLTTFSAQENPTDLYKRLIGLLLKAGRTEEAFGYVEESKSKIVRDAFAGLKPADAGGELKQTLLGVDQAQAKKAALETEIREEKKKPEEKQDTKKLETLTRTLAGTEGEFNQWMLKLKFQNRKMYDALSIKPATLGDVQGQVPRDAVFLEYFIAPDQLYVFCIGRDFFLARSTAVPEKELETLVNRFVRLCQEPPAGPLDERILSQGRKLYQVLIAPVEDVVEKYGTVVVIPFGALYYLPFQALIRNAEGPPEYLIERKRVCYTTSATFADILKNEARGHRSFVGFGNPDGSLPAASEELRTLRDKIFKSAAKVFTAGAATKAAFIDQAKNADIVHLATHGFLDEADPLASYLLFAGPSKEAQELTLSQVAQLTELRARNSLVFLSACQTAREEGAGGTGSELITLAEAFAMAGAPTLIATLWQVEDNATRLFAETFYDQLANKDKDKLDALRAGEIALIRSAEFSQPFYWASFILIGSWR